MILIPIALIVLDRTAKAAMIALAMEDSGLMFTKKKLLTKTKEQYHSEYLVIGAYACATTVLLAHFDEGPRPRNLEKSSR